MVDEVSSTLKSRTGNGKTGVGTRTTDADQSLVIVAPAEAATLTRGSHSDGVSFPGRHKEDDENLVVEAEPQTFDWQLSGGGSDKSFRGKGRSWIEDKPGTARALTSNKTLAVHVPAAVAFQQTPQGDLNVDPDGAVPPLLGREAKGVGNNSPLIATSSGRGHWDEDDEAATLGTAGSGVHERTLVGEPVAFDWTGDDPGNTPPGTSPPLPAGHAGEIAVGFIAGSGSALGMEDEVAPTVAAGDNGSTRTPTVYTKTHGAQDTEDAELWDTASESRTLNGMGYAMDVVVDDAPVAPLTAPKSGAGGSYRLDAHDVHGGHLVPEVPAEPRERTGAAVRRLTPTECERLQGLPDGWTALEPTTPDGPRYAGVGDSVTVNVPRWAIARWVRREVERQAAAS